MLTVAERQQRACDVGANVDYKDNTGAIHAGVVTKKYESTGQVAIFNEEDGNTFVGMDTTIMFVYPHYEPTTPLIDRVYVMEGA
jgi:hypothetical protein